MFFYSITFVGINWVINVVAFWECIVAFSRSLILNYSTANIELYAMSLSRKKQKSKIHVIEKMLRLRINNNKNGFLLYWNYNYRKLFSMVRRLPALRSCNRWLHSGIQIGQHLNTFEWMLFYYSSSYGPQRPILLWS